MIAALGVRRRFLVLLLVLPLLGTTGGYAMANAMQAPSGQVDVYAGPIRDSTNSRFACSFLDGANNNRGEIVNQQIIVTDPLNNELYRSDVIPELANYAPRQMTCLRSAQTGWLVVTTGGFEIGGGTSQPLTLSTKYPIRQPITYEEYAAGKR